MKTPLLVLLLLAPLNPVAFSCNKTETTCTANTGKFASAPIAAKTAQPPAVNAPHAAPPATPSRRTPGSRPPAHLFM